MYRRITLDEKKDRETNRKVIIVGTVRSIKNDELKLDTGSGTVITISFEDEMTNYKIGNIYEFRGEFLTEVNFNSDEATEFNKQFKLKLYNEAISRLNSVLGC